MKTSDLTLSIIIVIIFIILFLFNLIVVGMQRIKDNWPAYRCQPLVIPFASLSLAIILRKILPFVFKTFSLILWVI